MRDSVKQRSKELGLALLNFVLVLGLLFGVQALLRGHVAGTEGLVILSVVIFAAYLAGTRWIEGHRPAELVGKRVVAEFARGAWTRNRAVLVGRWSVVDRWCLSSDRTRGGLRPGYRCLHCFDGGDH